jgi:hypothetical protein
VPGADGIGDPIGCDEFSWTNEARLVKSGGAGLLDEILRAGMSMREILLWRANWPSLVLRV